MAVVLHGSSMEMCTPVGCFHKGDFIVCGTRIGIAQGFMQISFATLNKFAFLAVVNEYHQQDNGIAVRTDVQFLVAANHIRMACAFAKTGTGIETKTEAKLGAEPQC